MQKKKKHFKVGIQNSQFVKNKLSFKPRLKRNHTQLHIQLYTLTNVFLAFIFFKAGGEKK